MSYLSQIERNLLNPSVGTLSALPKRWTCRRESSCFRPRQARRASPLPCCAKGSASAFRFPQSSITYELLTPDLRRRASLLWLSAEPDAESGASLTHEGEDVVVVLKGRLDIEVGGIWYELTAGDSIYFNSELPHRWCNRGKGTAEAIWVSAPPSSEMRLTSTMGAQETCRRVHWLAKEATLSLGLRGSL